MKLVVDNVITLPERIGEPGVVWASRYTTADRWSVYGYDSGLIVANVTQAQAERVIENFQQSTSRHPSSR